MQSHVDWSIDDGDGAREFVAGRFDPGQRLLTFSGTETQNANNNDIVIGNYQATLSKFGTKLEKGEWDGNDEADVPGRWSARRIVMNRPAT